MEISPKYLAASIDADGCILIEKTGKQIKFRINISSTDFNTLNSLKNTFSGNIYSNTNKNGRNKTCYTLVFTDNTCKKVLDIIYPHLILKKAQADLVYKLIDLKNLPKNERYFFSTEGRKVGAAKVLRPEIYGKELALKEEMHILNKLGPNSILNPLNNSVNAEVDTEYLAGFFDSEGCCCIDQIGNAFHARVTITNTNLNILQVMQKVYRGIITKRPNTPKNNKDCYSLIWRSFKAEGVLYQIYPLLITKKPQIDLFFELMKLKKIPKEIRKERRPDSKRSWWVKSEFIEQEKIIHDKLRVLNKRGLDPITV